MGYEDPTQNLLSDGVTVSSLGLLPGLSSGARGNAEGEGCAS